MAAIVPDKEQADKPVADYLQMFPVRYGSVDVNESMADRLKRLRAIKGWSLREAAKHIGGVSYTAVDKWEKGENLSMRPETLYAVARAYGTDPAYILFGEDRTPPNDRSGRYRKVGPV